MLLVLPHQQLTAFRQLPHQQLLLPIVELIGFDIDLAVVTETTNDLVLFSIYLTRFEVCRDR